MNWNGFEVLRDYVETRISEYSTIGGDRKVILVHLAVHIREELQSRNQAHLIFICTHNSRRSHFGHLWAQLAASFYQVKGIFCYSGGSEATAFNPRAAKALEDSGLHISRKDASTNPLYLATFPGSEEGINIFSKRYFDPPNPVKDFIAVMTCSDADEACPVVHGALSRHAIHYADPKAFDGTLEESAGYADRCCQIAREMLYLFSRI